MSTIARDPLKGRDPTLERWTGERRECHRAMLLWAMQNPADRSLRAVGRAMGRSDGGMRNWQRSQCWKHRVAAYNEDADQVALDVYRREYMKDFGSLELPHVAHAVVVPLGTDLNSPAAKAAHASAIHVKSALDRATHAVEQATAQVVREHRADEADMTKRHIHLVDASLGLIARKLKADEIRVGVRDIPVLLECRDKLVRAVSGAQNGAAGPVVESARVAHAKASGGDVVCAMYEDAEELVVILGALRQRQQVDVEALSAQEAEREPAAG